MKIEQEQILVVRDEQGCVVATWINDIRSINMYSLKRLNLDEVADVLTTIINSSNKIDKNKEQ